MLAFIIPIVIFNIHKIIYVYFLTIFLQLHLHISNLKMLKNIIKKECKSTLTFFFFFNIIIANIYKR